MSKGGGMEFKLKSAEELFPLPLIRFEISEAARLNKQLLGEIASRRAKEEGLAKSNRQGWHSAPDLFDRKEPGHASLAKMLLRMMAEITRQFAPNTDFANLELVPDGWINVNPKGAYNAPHDHPGCFWSGVYYVHVPHGEGDAGLIEFLSPHEVLPHNGIIQAGITADKRRIRPSTGTVLIFPSQLMHWVYPNDSDEERVSIAFNGRFRRKRAT
jgi:uncharacterized protein (TIGR02466 family)